MFSLLGKWNSWWWNLAHFQSGLFFAYYCNIWECLFHEVGKPELVLPTTHSYSYGQELVPYGHSSYHNCMNLWLRNPVLGFQLPGKDILYSADIPQSRPAAGRLKSMLYYLKNKLNQKDESWARVDVVDNWVEIKNFNKRWKEILSSTKDFDNFKTIMIPQNLLKYWFRL